VGPGGTAAARHLIKSSRCGAPCAAHSDAIPARAIGARNPALPHDPTWSPWHCGHPETLRSTPGWSLGAAARLRHRGCTHAHAGQPCSFAPGTNPCHPTPPLMRKTTEREFAPKGTTLTADRRVSHQGQPGAYRTGAFRTHGQTRQPHGAFRTQGQPDHRWRGSAPRAPRTTDWP